MPDADDDLRQIREFVSNIYREEAGYNFIKRMFSEITPIGIYADIFPVSHFQTARDIHPEAKTLSIMKHHWTVVFHIDEEFVIVDKILPSSRMA